MLFPMISFAATAPVLAIHQNAALGQTELFPHLWGWMQALCTGLLDVLHWFSGLTGSWGTAIIVLAVLVRLATYPLARRALLSQKRFNEMHERLKPELQRIKRDFKGGEQSERIIALYKEHNLSPIAGVKPLLIVMLQLPIFVALFQILEHAPMLHGAGFLWIQDLARPDQLAPLGFHIPWLGDELSLLPFVLAATVVLAGAVVPGERSGDSGHRRRLWASVAMAVAFFFGFYPFPAGLMIYWIMNNLLQFAQQIIVGLGSPPSQTAVQIR